jgi:hypothetical protein
MIYGVLSRPQYAVLPKMLFLRASRKWLRQRYRHHLLVMLIQSATFQEATAVWVPLA